MDWFELTNSNPINPSHYTFRSVEPSCGGNDRICAVQAVNDGGVPVLSETLKDEMIIALNDRTASTHVLLKG